MSNLDQTGVHSRTLTAFFDSHDAAQHAARDLVAAGIPQEHITTTGGDAATTTTGDDHGFWDSLKDMFLPEDDRHVYSEGLRRGGYLVAVRADESNYTRVMDIMDRDGAINLDEREATWKKEGWTGYTGAAVTGNSAAGAGIQRAVDNTSFHAVAPTTSTTSLDRAGGTAANTLAEGHDEVVPVYEENIQVGKRDLNHGRVRLRSYVVETPVSQQVKLRSESVQVERRPVDRAIGAGDAVFQDRVIEAEEHAEEAVVTKEARVKEEISLRKTSEDRVQTISDTVRRTEVEVEDTRGHAVSAGAQRFASETDSAQIAAYMDVISSDGAKIGTVDHLDGPDKIKLAKNTSPDGQHHYVPLDWVDHVDTHVHLNKTATAAKAGW